MTEPPPEAHEFVKTSHDFAMWMIQLADAKADILVAASAILAALLVPEAVRTAPESSHIAFGLAVGLALLSTGLSLATVFPRTSASSHESTLYFTTFDRHGSSKEYHSYLQSLKTGDLDLELAKQTWELAKTQAAKYRFLRASVVTFGMCLAVTFIGVMISL